MKRWRPREDLPGFASRHDFPSDDPRLVYMISTVVDVVDVTPILFDL